MSVKAVIKRTRRDGRHWVFAAIAMPMSPLLLGLAIQQSHARPACLSHDGTPVTPNQAACITSYASVALSTLGFWALAIATVVTGAVLGLLDGRSRRRFARGYWISMSVVGLCAPWALLAYTLGHGLGRLLPAPRRSSMQPARQGGWAQAVQLYRALAGGQPPPTVFAPDLPGPGTVYMDVPFRFSRWYGTDVTYQPGSLVAVGSPGLVAAAAVGRLIVTSIGYARAAGLSRRRWCGHDPARVVVTANTTWCQVRGRWLRFDHNAVVQYQVTADQSCILTFGDSDIPPLRLYGPSAWCHAVLYAYLRYGTGWQNAPFLSPLQQAAQPAFHHVSLFSFGAQRRSNR
jgi:hypothetical protein